MTCPQCLERDTLRKFVDVTLSMPLVMTAVSKANIRSRDVEIISANWDNARYSCINCGWHMEREIQRKGNKD